MLLGQNVSPRMALASTIVDAINSVYDRATNEAEQLVDEMEAQDLDSLAHELEEATGPARRRTTRRPIIRLVNSLIFRAAKERASDIHIEPMERELIVRFRIDGVLQEVIKPPKRYQNAIISRVKIMGQLNIAEKRLPQDGRIRIKLAGRDIDIRLSTVPTAYGERIVMRLLDKTRDAAGPRRDRHGAGHARRHGRSVIRRPHGIFLVTGPTGSRQDDHALRRALEDQHAGPQHPHRRGPGRVPARGHRPDADQPEDRPDLRARAALLPAPGPGRHHGRRDPRQGDGGDRDPGVAHRPPGVLHGPHQRRRRAPSRASSTWASSRSWSPLAHGVLAQRLVRRVCPDCREPYTPTEEELKELGFTRRSSRSSTAWSASTRPRAAPRAARTATAAAPASTS